MQSAPIYTRLTERLTHTPWLSWLAALFLGALLPLGFAPFHVWPMGIICPALLALLMHRAAPAQQLSRCALFAVGFFSVGASWVYVSIHEFGAASVALACLLTGLFVLVLSFFFCLPFYLQGRFGRQQGTGFLLLFPGLWLLAEWIRSWIFTGFPWLLVGYTQTHTPLSGFAPLGGIYTTGFATLLAATGLSLTLATRRPAWLLLPAAVFCGGAGLQQITWTQPTGTPVQIGMVQLNIPQERKWDPEFLQPTFDKLRTMSEPLWASSDWIIWPEAAVPQTYHQALPFLNEMYARASDTNTALLTGVLFDDQQQWVVYNSVMGLGNASGIFHKQHLVPFGEYVPLEQWLRKTIQFFNLPTSYITPGPTHQSLLRAGELRVAPALCYEIVYADLVAERAASAEVILTISNDAWFGDSLGPHQHMEMAQMRAIENGRYVIRSTNNGITGVINPAGDIEKQLPQFVAETMQASISGYSGQTPFMRWGSTPMILLAALWVAAIGAYTYRRPQNQ